MQLTHKYGNYIYRIAYLKECISVVCKYQVTEVQMKLIWSTDIMVFSSLDIFQLLTSFLLVGPLNWMRLNTVKYCMVAYTGLTDHYIVCLYFVGVVILEDMQLDGATQTWSSRCDSLPVSESLPLSWIQLLCLNTSDLGGIPFDRTCYYWWLA